LKRAVVETCALPHGGPGRGRAGGGSRREPGARPGSAGAGARGRGPGPPRAVAADPQYTPPAPPRHDPAAARSRGPRPCRAPAPAPLAAVRLGVYRAYFLKDLDTDTRAVTEGAFEKLRRVGITIVDVDMPDLQKSNDAASFPVALYEAYDDLKAYLARYQT